MNKIGQPGPAACGQVSPSVSSYASAPSAVIWETRKRLMMPAETSSETFLRRHPASGFRTGFHFIAMLLFVSLPACGRAEAPKQSSSHGFAIPKHQPVKATLVAEHEWFNPTSGTRVGVLFELEKGWHIYAQSSGDAGMPTEVYWKPGNVAVIMSELVWPEPEHFIDPGDIKTNGYSGSVVLSSTLSSNPHVTIDWMPELMIGAHVKWLACKDICLPGEAELLLRFPALFLENFRSTAAAFNSLAESGSPLRSCTASKPPGFRSSKSRYS